MNVPKSRIKLKGEIKMAKYVCSICGYVYDEAAGCPDQGIAPGTKFEDLPDDFVCPMCGVDKDAFEKQ
jgi:rubredoxin